MNINIGRIRGKYAGGVDRFNNLSSKGKGLAGSCIIENQAAHLAGHFKILKRGIPSSGSVLLEVVLALALFVAAATIVSSGLRASVQSAERLRQTARAEDLAISVLSELQLGLRPLETGSAQPFPSPFEEWTSEIIATSGTEGGAETTPNLATVEVVIRHTPSETVRRLTQTIRIPQLISMGSTNEVSSGTTSGISSGGSFP